MRVILILKCFKLISKLIGRVLTNAKVLSIRIIFITTESYASVEMDGSVRVIPQSHRIPVSSNYFVWLHRGSEVTGTSNSYSLFLG